MTLGSFMKDMWQLIKDYKWVILLTALITTVFSVGIVIFISKQDQPSDQLTSNQESAYNKVGAIDIYADESFENIQLEPHLLGGIIADLHSWESFRAFFSLNSSNPEITTSQPIDNYFNESSNPIQDFLGIDPTQHDNVKIHPDTGNAYVTVEINPENGNIRLVNVQEGFNDFRIQLDVDAEEGTFAEDIGEDVDDLLNFKIGMTPGEEQFGYIESAYNWTGGLNFPRMLSQRKNFYIVNPVEYIPTSIISANNSLSIRSLILPGTISLIIGVILGVTLAFMLALFNNKIKYSFAYGWAAEDLFLKYDKEDDRNQISYDILQSEFKNLAIISEGNLPIQLIDKIQDTQTKNVKMLNEISDIEIGKSIEEFILIINRNKTTKDWYRRQRKHLDAYRQKAVKIIEL